jgi:capsular exopolysaccharide synthesis family protein
VLAIALGTGIPATILVLRLPPIFRTSASMMIEAPHFDEAVSRIIPHGGLGLGGPQSDDKYVPNRLAQLRGRALVEKAVSDPALMLPPGGDPVQEIINGLQTRKLPDTTYFDLFLEGTDPERITKLLNALLKEFAHQAKTESGSSIDNATKLATSNISKIEDDLKALDEEIVALLKRTPIFGPNGTSLLQEQFVVLNSILMGKRVHFDQLMQEQRLAHIYPVQRGEGPTNPYERELAELERERQLYTLQLQDYRRRTKRFDSDPASRNVARRLNEVLDRIEELRGSSKRGVFDRSAMVLSHAREEVDKLDRHIESLRDRMRSTMPEFQQYLGLMRDRQRKEESLATMQTRLKQFEFLAKTHNDPVRILQFAVEPAVPVRPNRPLYIAIAVVLALALGIGFVCLLESFDHRVKVPEHLTAGVALPLLGVVPRIRRLARIYRGGHLWTPGAPNSLGADAYRNLRASLVAAGGPRGPITTLLVTSPKEGEGKSTTALNLAATCARAGERTLLVDCDLRRPSLDAVFGDDAQAVGLVDVLRGDLPWQRSVAPSDIPNLDFLPVGDPSGIPVEILGTVELQELIKAVSSRYHRVILDGPAVLGMADCRMLGRVVEGTILVIRCGAHALSPVQRARAMLEQSRVNLLGIVFNGLDDDLENWSSYSNSGDLDALDEPLRRRAGLPGGSAATEASMPNP